VPFVPQGYPVLRVPFPASRAVRRAIRVFRVPPVRRTASLVVSGHHSLSGSAPRLPGRGRS